MPLVIGDAVVLARIRAHLKCINVLLETLELGAETGVAVHDGSEPQAHAASMCSDDEPPGREVE